MNRYLMAKYVVEQCAPEKIEKPDRRDLIAYIVRETLLIPASIGFMAILLYGFWYFFSAGGWLSAGVIAACAVAVCVMWWRRHG